jgi:Ca-activated chloride channel homolog
MISSQTVLRTWILWPLILILCTGIASHQVRAAEPVAAPQTGSKQVKAKPLETDVSSEVRAWNSGRYSPPSTEFHAGQATPKNEAAPVIAKTPRGFIIKLPSGAPIPTLTVRDGKLYASGGFQSREFYCFAADSGKLVWAVDLDDDGPTSAVVEEGVVVFNTESCTIFVLDANTGKMLWSRYLGDPLASTPTVCNGRVFTSYPATVEPKLAEPNQTGNLAPQQDSKQPAKGQETAVAENPPPTHVLVCFDLKTGKVLWQRWIDSDVMSAPVAIENDLYVSTFGGAVYRFNQANGALLSARNARATSAPVIVGSNVFFTRRADDGQGKKVEEALVKWDRPLTTERFASVRKEAPHLDAVVQARSEFNKHSLQLGAANAIGGGGFGGGGAFDVADDPSDGKSNTGSSPTGNADKETNAGDAASAPLGAVAANIGLDNVFSLQAFQGSRIVNAGKLNFNCMGDQVLCTDPVSGKVAWSLKLEGDMQKEGGYLAAPPAAAGGQIFLATLKGEVLQLEPTKGTVTHRYPVGAALRFQPTIQDGRIYVGTQDGQVVCIDTGDMKLTGWSTWGGNAAHTGIREEAKK